MKRALHAEWTKLRSVPGFVLCLLAAAGSIVAVAIMISSGNPGTYGRAAFVDQFRFVHQPLTGDGTLVARVRAQEHTHPWAMAGLMVKQSPTPGAPYAALLVTPGHGVRMQANFSTDIAGSASTGPRWLKLTRTGDTITGYESGDGTAWSTVGTVTLATPAAEIGLFVTSPGMTRVQPMRPALVQMRPGTATFDSVRLTPGPGIAWNTSDVGHPAGIGQRPVAPLDGVFAVTGSGDIIGHTDDGSRVVAATAGTIFGALPIVALGAMVMTSEYRWRTISGTLAASPRRGRILAAKTITVAGVTFVTGIIATLTALLVTQPLLQRNGYRPPIYPGPSLSDPAVLRIVSGTAMFLTLLALLGLGLGATLRSSAGAITLVAAAVFVPMITTPFLPAAIATWVQRLSPTAGLSLQQFRETDDTLLVPWAGQQWAGFAVLCGYASIALAAGLWLLRRRDA